MNESMKITKLTKYAIMENMGSYYDLPEMCQVCYGFSKWDGDKEYVPYDKRDCTECSHRPETF